MRYFADPVGLPMLLLPSDVVETVSEIWSPVTQCLSFRGPCSQFAHIPHPLPTSTCANPEHNSHSLVLTLNHAYMHVCLPTAQQARAALSKAQARC